MCVGIPMQVASIDPQGRALCEHDGEINAIDLSLVGEVAPGEWIMTFLGAARERMDEQSALRSLAAVQAVQAIMAGGEADIEAAFADLIGREPALPAHLQTQDQNA